MVGSGGVDNCGIRSGGVTSGVVGNSGLVR